MNRGSVTVSLVSHNIILFIVISISKFNTIIVNIVIKYKKYDNNNTIVYLLLGSV